MFVLDHFRSMRVGVSWFNNAILAARKGGRGGLAARAAGADVVRVADGWGLPPAPAAGRRDWFVGSITNEDARDLDVPLGFLGSGEYDAEFYVLRRMHMKIRFSSAIHYCPFLPVPFHGGADVTVGQARMAREVCVSSNAQGHLAYTVTFNAKNINRPLLVGIVVDKWIWRMGPDRRCETYKVNETTPGGPRTPPPWTTATAPQVA